MNYRKFFALAAFAAIALPAAADYNINFEKGSGGWVSYNYWGGKLSRSAEAAHKGKMSMKMETTVKRNRNYGLCILPIMDKHFSGLRVKLSFYAKGNGSIKAGMLCYSRNRKGGMDMKFEYGTPVTLNDQWQKVEYTADFTGRALERIAPAIDLSGPATAFIDDTEVVFLKPAGISMTSLSTHQIVREGDALPPAKFKFSIADEVINFFAFAEDLKFPVVRSSAINEDNGEICYADKTALPKGEAVLIAAANGRNAIHISQVVPKAEYDELDKIAKQIKLAKPMHILFIGDSLTDRDRGSNHADKLVWWLNKYNPGKVSMQNLAVSGDFITRVEGRMNYKLKTSKTKEWRQNVYNNLFNRPYDLIIISLGHNDCVSFKKLEYKTPRLSIPVAEASYKKVISILRARSKAPIVLMTPVANNLEQSKKEGALSVKYGGVGAVFGLPEFVQPFNAMLKKVASETGCCFADVYTPMLNNPQIPQWFIRDGVHLTPAGHQALSGVLLKVLAEKGSLLK